MHIGNGKANVAGNFQDFRLSEESAKSRVHKANEAVTRAVLHENKDFVASSITVPAGLRVNVVDNRWVSL